ncbi:nitrilase [Myxococcota bacterium]|nr:nitrilase [Myxococcota bacterium]
MADRRVQRGAGAWAILLLGLVFSVGVGGRWSVPVAAWLAPVFLLRFTRSRRPLAGWAILTAGGTPLAVLTMWGIVPMPLGALVVQSAFGAAFGALVYLADRLVAPRQRGLAATLVFPAAWTATEALVAGSAPFGIWGLTPNTQVGVPAVLQVVALAGPFSLTFLIGWGASVANHAWERGFAGPEVRRCAAAALAVFGSVALLGGARSSLSAHDAPTVRIAGITPSREVIDAAMLDRLLAGESLDLGALAGAYAGAADIHDDLLGRSAREARAGARIVFWSEGAAPVLEEAEGALVARGRGLAREEGIYLGLSLMVLRRAGDAFRWTNKVVMVTPAGEVAYEYLKAIPVPGFEARSTDAGDGEARVVDTPYGRLATLICFDMDFPGLARRAAKAGADIVLVPAHDWREISPMHTQMASMRAVEQGFALVRQVGLGWSAAFDRYGRTLASMDHFQTEDRVLVAHVPTRGARTPYSRTGEWLGPACGAVFLVQVLLALRRRGPT